MRDPAPPLLPRGRRLAAWITTAVPFAALAVAVYLWGVDLPFWDQSQVVPLIEKLLEGRLELADVWHQHNDHRVFFPRLVMLALAPWTRWNTRWEMGVVVVLAAGFFLVAVRWLRESFPSSPAGWVLAPAASLLVFNLNQWENWTLGLQIVYLMNVLAVIGGLYVLARGAHHAGGFVLGAVLGFVATFSFSNGLLFWPLALALVLRPPGAHRWRRAFAWLLVTAVVTGLFFHGYSSSLGASRLSLPIGQLPRAAAFVVVFLGAPVFSYDGKLAATGGLVACGAFLGLLVRLARDRRLFFERALPWVVVAGYGIGSGVLAAAGRLGLGLALAMSSRYIVYANFFWLGLGGLALVWLENRDTVPIPVRLAAVAVTLSLVAGSIWGGVLVHQQYLDRTRVRQALIEGRFHPDMPLTFPENWVPGEEFEALRRHRLSLFREAP